MTSGQLLWEWIPTARVPVTGTGYAAFNEIRSTPQQSNIQVVLIRIF